MWTYNSDDTINTITDARGASQSLSYNARHLKTSITYASGSSGAPASAEVSFTYDAAGNRTTMTDGLGSKTYHYNELSQLSQEERQFSVGTFDISYTYNLAGQVTVLTDPFGASFSYTRDVRGQLKAVTGSPYAGTTTYITDVIYRAWGAPKSVNYVGSNSTIAFNARMKPTEFRLTNSTGGSIMRENYSYHPDGRVAALTDLDDTAGSNPPVSLRFLSRAYTYDQLGRVTSGFGTGNAGQGVPFSQNYSYDAFGNMTMRSGRYYNYNFAGPTSDTATYVNNRRIGWNYNSDGEVISTPLTSTDQPRTMTYDAAAQMVTSVETGAFSNITYAASYDGDGEVAYESSTISPGTSEASYIVRSSVLDGEVLTRLDQFGNKKITHVPAGGLLFATQRADTSGSFVLLTKRNPLGTSETTKVVYDPLGNYIPFQAHGSPQPPPGSFSSASMGGLATNQANPYSSAVGCMMDGLPTTCNRVQQAINRGESRKLIINARGQNPNVALASMGWFLVEHEVKPQRPSTRPRLRSRRPNPSPGNRDPFNVGSDEGTTWGFTLVALEPQKPRIQTTAVPLVNLKKLLQDTLAYGDCADFMTRLLAKAGELSNGKNDPISTDIMEIYSRLNRQARGGIELNHVGSDYYNYWSQGYQRLPAVPGGGGIADGSWQLQNRKVVIDQVEIPINTTALNVAMAPYTYAKVILHEFFHVAGSNSLYYHDIMDASARALGSTDADAAIREHCIPREMW